MNILCICLLSAQSRSQQLVRTRERPQAVLCCFPGIICKPQLMPLFAKFCTIKSKHACVVAHLAECLGLRPPLPSFPAASSCRGYRGRVRRIRCFSMSALPAERKRAPMATRIRRGMARDFLLCCNMKLIRAVGQSIWGHCYV